MPSVTLSIYSFCRSTCQCNSPKKEIRGIRVKDKEIKLSQYADDTTLILDGSEESFLESLKVIDYFGNISGLRLNSKKTEALWIGASADWDFKLCPQKDFKWPKKKVRALGVWLSTDPDVTISLNYKDKIEKTKLILGCWKLRRLSLLGKITVLKSLIASQLVYIFSPLETNHAAIRDINVMFYNFLWNGKGDKIKRNIMINDYSEGGLKMIDIASFNRSLKATWIKKYLDKENCGSWKSFFDSELEKYGSEVTLTGNLNTKDSRNIIKVSDPFFREILEIWSEANYEENILSDYHLRSSPLWYNSLIRVENRPVFYKDWYLKGITKVEHLMDDSGKFLSLTAFQTIHDLTVRPLSFLGIISSIKFLQRYIPHNTRSSLKHESFLTKFLRSKKPSRLVYKKLVSEKSESPNQSQQKWQEDIILMTKQELNWKEAYQMAFQCTKSTKLVTFNFKFLHRRISTNNLLKKIGLADSEKCTFCEKETEKLAHLFWTCPKTQAFWTNFKVWLQSCQVIAKETPLEPDTALGLRPDNSKNKLQINFCCLNAKYYIWLCRQKKCPPKLDNFLQYLKHIYEIENNKTTIALKKWEPLLALL